MGLRTRLRAITRRRKPDPDPRLPQEIVDIITDFLHDDPRTLRFLLLVSPKFFPGCRYHLNSFTIVRATDSGQWNSKDFAQILRASPEFGLFVKRLFIVGGTAHRMQESGQMTAGFFGEMLQLLPNLTWVGFSGVQFRERFNHLPWFRDVPLPNSIQRAQLPYPFLGKLLLNATEWEAPEFIHFLSLFSRIGILNTRGVRGSDDSGDGGVVGEDDAEIYLARIDSLASLVSHLVIDQYATSPQDLPLVDRIMRHTTKSETTRALP